MAKPKSMKQRTLITLRALYKYSDAEHRMNTVKLNEFLRPYGLNCTSRVLNDTVRVMRESGIDVRNKGEWDNQGIWIEDRPLPSHELRRLIFAVTTNPHLSKTQATEILQSLKPLVTVYQEDLLQGLIDTEPTEEPDDSLYWTFSVIQEAIQQKRRIRYTVDYLKYNGQTQGVEAKREWATLFTPKSIYQTQGQLYMVGYNNTDKRVDAVNLKDISSIKLAFKHKDPKANLVNEWIANIVPQDWVPGERREIIYEGPAVFRCRGQYVAELFHRFSAPDGPVVKDARSRAIYAVKKAFVTDDDIFWLSRIPNQEIRIAGPGALVEAVRNYYKRTEDTLLNPNLPANKK